MRNVRALFGLMLATLALTLSPNLDSATSQEPRPAVPVAEEPKSESPDGDPEPLEYPTVGILPKAATGVPRFLEAHPEFDGRGVVVAIFDTGIDPGAVGLQTTTDGKPKIIDMIDGTGSGDVDTSTVRQATEHTLEGLTGRTLELDPNWNNPSGEYHLGMKAAYHFFPSELIPRLKRARRREWNIEQRKVETELRRQLREWDAAHENPTDEQKQEREELQNRLDQLEALAENYDDPGPIYDCVVFHDGTHWRAVVDTDEDGNLAEEETLTDYRFEHEYATFAGNPVLNFSVNIYDSGNLLSIVTDSGAHGTHVAGIVAANFPEHPELNGIAPGAQLVSVKIGDSRLAGMETGAGMVRGLNAVLRNNCDLINMSYGEPTSTPDHGRLVELFSEMVNRHNIVFVAAAGNSGPALSTVIAPGGTTSAVIGVGAYVSPEMMQAAYTLRERLPAMPYTWSSRGPAFDGALGVDIAAPGGAIAPVPNWTLQRSMLMNGTSMASPNACGNVALLISGLKASNVAYSPYSIRRALENTAQTIEGAEVFAQGQGLLQVDAAYDYLLRHAGHPGARVQFEIEIADRDGARGLYLRDDYETRFPTNSVVRVQPLFGDEHDPEINPARIDFLMRIVLQTTAPWLTCGDQLMLTHGGNRFELHVDPTELPPGAHYAEVQGFDAESPGRGPMFRVPVTVIRADEMPTGEFDPAENTLEFAPGQIVRQFIAVPAGATWADLTLKLNSTGGPRRFMVHALQIIPGENFHAAEKQEFLTLEPGAEKVLSFPVSGKRMLELCLAQYWSSLGASTVQYQLQFHGIRPDRDRLTLPPGGAGTRVDAVSLVQREVLEPKAELKTHRKLLRPIESEIRPLSPERDLLPDQRQIYQMVLTYQFEQEEPGKITPHFPETEGLLYDSEFGSQIWLLFDAGKQRVAADDVFPEAVTIGRGKHVLKLQLRHSDVDKLNERKDMILQLDRSLDRPLSLDLYPSRAVALRDGEKFSAAPLPVGRKAAFYVAAPSHDELPSDAEPGDVLIGTMTLGTDNAALPGSGHRPGGFPVTFVVPPAPADVGSENGSDAEATEDEAEDDAELEFLVERLKQIPFETKREEFEQLFAEILEIRPGHLPALVVRLHRLDAEDHRKERLEAVVEAADAVLAEIDTAALAAHYGTNVNPEDSDAKAARQEMDEKRKILVDALYRKGRALGYMELPDVIAEHPIEDPEAHDRAFEANFAELRKWVDTTEKDYVLLHVRRERRRGRFGTALELLNRHAESSAPNYWYVKKRRDIFEKLGWTHAFENEQKRLLIRFPKDYESF